MIVFRRRLGGVPGCCWSISITCGNSAAGTRVAVVGRVKGRRNASTGPQRPPMGQASAGAVHATRARAQDWPSRVFWTRCSFVPKRDPLAGFSGAVQALDLVECCFHPGAVPESGDAIRVARGERSRRRFSAGRDPAARAARSRAGCAGRARTRSLARAGRRRSPGAAPGAAADPARRW